MKLAQLSGADDANTMGNPCMQALSPAPLLVDAHVHFHSCFDQDLFLDAALANFRRGAADLGLGEGFLGCLLLAEAGRPTGSTASGAAARAEPGASSRPASRAHSWRAPPVERGCW